MEFQFEITRNNVDERKCFISVAEENECPICKKSISPVYIASSLNSQYHASVFNYCIGCKNTFITPYEIICADTSHSTAYYRMKQKRLSEPNKFNKQVFDDKISDLSPQFDKIYNQALAAESSQLDEIAGLGYRKAMEFLIKDFAIHENPNDAETIKKMLLGQCINQYIDNDHIKTLASRSAWIGNDEAHYIRKQEDRDVQDMKSFIQAIVYFIGMILITEDASTMEPK